MKLYQAWEQRKLGEMVNVYDGVHQTPEYQDSGVMFLSVENIATLKSEKYISEEAFERDYKVYPEKGDILMTRIGDVGTTNVVETSEKVAFYVSLALLKPNRIDSYFLSNAMKTTQFQKGLRERTLVTAIPQKINKDEIGKVNIFVTNNVDEQYKIGQYFANLDHLITLHQRKCNETKELKKFMLQKMFPKKNEKKPEIRFAGFDDDWEQRKLGEIANKVTKKNQDAVVTEVFTNSAEFGIISQRDFFDKDIANAENINSYYVVEPDDFVYNSRISTTAPFGPIKRNKLEKTGAMSPLYYVFKPHDIDLTYLEGFFQTTRWHAFMKFNGNSGARSDRFAITDKIFNKMPISMPQDIDEQRMIGMFLTELDHLITLHRRAYYYKKRRTYK